MPCCPANNQEQFLAVGAGPAAGSGTRQRTHPLERPSLFNHTTGGGGGVGGTTGGVGGWGWWRKRAKIEMSLGEWASADESRHKRLPSRGQNACCFGRDQALARLVSAHQLAVDSNSRIVPLHSNRR